MRRCDRELGLILAGAMVAAVVGLGGCGKPATEYPAYRPPPPKDYNRALPPGALALRKIPPERYPDFTPGLLDRAGLREAITHSLGYLAKPSSERYYPYGDIAHARVVRSLERFAEMLDQGMTADEINAVLHRDFDVYQSVGCDDAGTVLFTGYYCPIFDARLERDAKYRYPLYRLPPDLVKDAEGTTLGTRQPDGTVTPGYATRRQLEDGRTLDGWEIAWLADPFEAYVVTVQGSAKLRLEDGGIYEIGYAGNNGHTYTPIAERMVADGAMKRGEVSLPRLREYFRRHPERVYEYAWENDRYVFFQPAPGGPFGSLNTPVTLKRTIATDKSVFPRAGLAFADTKIPVRTAEGIGFGPFQAFVLDQDTGGAIRAAGRCDIYMGIGPEAEAIAGRTMAEGELYYVFIREMNAP